MHAAAVSCSSLPPANSADYARKMHLDSRIYVVGDEMKKFFDTLVDLNQYVSQGQYYIKMLYSYRGTSTTVPLKLSEEDEKIESRQDEYRKTLFLLLRTEIVKLSDLMTFCEKSMTFFTRILDDLNTYQENYATFPEEILLATVRFVDMMVKIDALKDSKTCLKNDFALYKRTFYLIKDQLEEAEELGNEINQIQMFLSNPMHNKHYVLTMSRDILLQSKDGRYESVLLELICMCIEKSYELFSTSNNDDAIEKSLIEFSCDQRYCPIRVLPHLYVLLDGLMGENGKTINIFEMKKYKFDSSAEKIFKNLPVIPLMYEMVIEVPFTLELCLNYKQSGSKICKKVFKFNQKIVNKFYSLSSNDNIERIVEKEDLLCKYLESMLSVEKNSAKIEKKKKTKNKNGSTAGKDDAAIARRELFINVFKAFHSMGDASTAILTHIGWKYANPSSLKENDNANVNSAVNENNKEYARRVLFNYTSEEKDSIINLIGSTKNLANVLLKNEDYIRVEIRKHIHTLLQQFVQDTLPSMLRKAYKAKKAESIELMVQLRRIVCDWNGNNGEEPNNLYELKKKDRKNHLHKFQWKTRLAMPSPTQIIVFRHILGKLFHESSESMKSDQGVVFKSRLFTNEDVSKMEVLYDLSKYFYHMLSYRDTIEELSSFSCLWYREFYLEICKESQFPISLSMPWILVEHIIFTPNIYNDAANEALRTLGQQYLFDEVEGEMNLVFDQLLYMMNRHLYTYYKNISISLQDDTTYRKLNPQHRFHSRNEEQRIWSEYFMSGKNKILQNKSYDMIRNTNNLTLLGRKLNLSKILSAALEREMIRDLEKCFQDLEQHDICGIIRFEGLINALDETHNMLTKSVAFSDDHSSSSKEEEEDDRTSSTNILNFVDLVNAVNESVSINSGGNGHLGRISTFIVKELYNTLIPNMVYISMDQEEYGRDSRNGSSFVYTQKYGNVVNKHTGKSSSKVDKMYEKIRIKRHFVAHNVNNTKHQASANTGKIQDGDDNSNNNTVITNADITNHFRFGNTTHSKIYENNYFTCEFFFSEIHTRSLLNVTNKIIGNAKANKMYDILYKTLLIQMEEKIIPYIMALLPGVKPVILPSYMMKTNVNYLAVEATVKGFLRYHDVNHKVFKGLQEIGNTLIFLQMLDWSFHNLEHDNDTRAMHFVDKTSTYHTNYVKQKTKKTSTKKRRKSTKKQLDPEMDEYCPNVFFDSYLLNNERPTPESNDKPTKRKDIKYSFLRRGLISIKNVLKRELKMEKAFENIPMLFASLLFILCRPDMNAEDNVVQPINIYKEYGEGLLFGCISILHCLGLKDVLMEKSYNQHVINVHIFEQATIAEEEAEKKQKKKSKSKPRRSSIGNVDKRTENEIRTYLSTATKVERLISLYSNFFDDQFKSLNQDDKNEINMRLGNVTPKNNSKKVIFSSISNAPNSFEQKIQESQEHELPQEYAKHVERVDRTDQVIATKSDGQSVHLGQNNNFVNNVLPHTTPSVGRTDESSNLNFSPSKNAVLEEDLQNLESGNVDDLEEEEVEMDDEEELDAVCMVYILYDYEAQNEDELSLTEGGYVMVTELGTAEDGDWWTGYVKNDAAVTGTFPKNYVSLMLEYENKKYLISTDTNEVYSMNDMDECLGVFDDSTYVLTDTEGNVQDWTSAVLL